MSYQTWQTYGYGICVSDIGGVPVERLQTLLDHAPAYHAEIQEYFEECGISQPKYDDYLEFDMDSCLGLATILMEVILEAENVQFTACDDAYGFDYLIYPPTYPWDRSASDDSLTEEKIRQILSKYVSLLTDAEITIDYQSVENGG